MKEHEKKLIADLLDLASEEFSNHGCNDVPEEFFKDWSDEQKIKFNTDYLVSIGENPDDYELTEMNNPDWGLMDYLSNKIEKSL